MSRDVGRGGNEGREDVNKALSSIKADSNGRKDTVPHPEACQFC